jgi:capsular polysaccharide biosynthesis protein
LIKRLKSVKLGEKLKVFLILFLEAKMDEDEVELRDYINVLLKRKKLIIGVTLVAILVSGILSYFVLPPIYRGSAVISPAQIGTNPFLDLSEVQEEIKSSPFIQKLSNDLNVPFDKINTGINASISQNSNLLVVDFESKDKNLIKSFFNKLLLELNNLNKDAYEKQIEGIESKISTLSSQSVLISTEESQINEKIQQLEQNGTVKSEYFLEDSLLSGVQNSLISQIIGLEGTINDLNTQLKESREFLYFYQPVVLDIPVKPNKKFNVAIATVAALFFSILIAFFLEYWNGTQDSKNKEVKALRN